MRSSIFCSFHQRFALTSNREIPDLDSFISSPRHHRSFIKPHWGVCGESVSTRTNGWACAGSTCADVAVVILELIHHTHHTQVPYLHRKVLIIPTTHLGRRESVSVCVANKRGERSEVRVWGCCTIRVSSNCSPRTKALCLSRVCMQVPVFKSHTLISPLLPLTTQDRSKYKQNTPPAGIMGWERERKREKEKNRKDEEKE